MPLNESIGHDFASPFPQEQFSPALLSTLISDSLVGTTTKEDLYVRSPHKKSFPTALNVKEMSSSLQIISSSSSQATMLPYPVENLPMASSPETSFSSVPPNSTLDFELWKAMSFEWDFTSTNASPLKERENTPQTDSLSLEALEENHLAATPTSAYATVLNHLGNRYETSGNFIEAYECFVKSSQLLADPATQAIAEAGMKLCLLRMGNELLSAKKIKEAQRYYEAVQLDMFNLNVHATLLEQAYQHENWQLALEQVHVMQVLFPQEPSIYHHLMYLYQQHAELAKQKGNKALYDEYIQKAKAVLMQLVKMPVQALSLSESQGNKKEETVNREKACVKSNTSFSNTDLYASLYGDQHYSLFTQSTKRKQAYGLQTQKQNKKEKSCITSFAPISFNCFTHF